MIRSGAAKTAHWKKWRPLIGGSVIRYRFGLKPFERFEIVTRLSCWDEKWFYFEHRVESKRGISVIALGKVLLHNGVRSISPAEVLATLSAELTSPPVPEDVAEWMLLERMLRAEATDGSCSIESASTTDTSGEDENFS